MDVAPWDKHWIKIEFIGISRDSFVFDSIWCYLLVLDGIWYLVFDDIQWCSVIFVGILRDSEGFVGIFRDSLGFVGIRLDLLVSDGI